MTAISYQLDVEDLMQSQSVHEAIPDTIEGILLDSGKGVSA